MRKKCQDGSGITLVLERELVERIKKMAIDKAYESKVHIVWTDLIRDALMDKFMSKK